MNDLPSRNRRDPGARANVLRRGGFTLVELLVVVSIIVLLVAVLMPGLAKAKLLAKRASCMSNFRNIGAATGIYQSYFGDFVPICWQNLSPPYANPWKSWRTSLLPYVAGFDTFNCPGASDWGQQAELFHSADDLTGQNWAGTANAGSYGIMYQDSLPSFTAVNDASVVTRGHPVWSCAFSTKPGMAWTDPAASVYAADACLTDGPLIYPTQGHKGLGTSVIVPPSDPAYSSGTLTRRFADRHVGTNCVFVDGHVSSYATQDLDSMVVGSAGCIWDVN